MIRFFKRAAPVETKSSLTSRSLMDLFWPAAPTRSGFDVTPLEALKQPTAYACFKIICETTAQMPLYTFDRDGKGVKERDRQSVFNRMFTHAPNPWTTAFRFKHDMTADVVLYGHAFALILTDSTGEPRFLRHIPSRAVRVDEDLTTGEPSYHVTLEQGGTKSYGYPQIIHLKAYEGQAPVKLAREAIGLALAQEAELAKSLASGMRPNGVLTFEHSLSEQALERAQKQFAAMSQSKGTAILDSNARYYALAMSAVDAQFLEMRRHQIADIARAFRVPLHMLQELERVTHQNAEQLGRQFLQFTMLPWLQMWTAELNLKLGTPDGSRFFDFATDDIQRADLAAMMEALGRAVSNGILNRNEAREYLNRPAYDGGADFLTPLNLGGASDD